MSEKLNPANPILVVDDEESILLSVDTTLRMSGLNNILTCQDSRKAAAILGSRPVGLVLMDLSMPHMSGEELLCLVNGEYPEIPVIVVTGTMDIESAVKCIKSGAFDYVVKPFEEDRLISAVSRALDFRSLQQVNSALRQHMLSDALDKPEAFAAIVTGSKKMRSIFQYVESIAPTMQPVLITGETGTGKELIAAAIHKASGRRGNYVIVNVAGLDDNVFSDTLFGHVKGAFTGADSPRRGMIERAEGGTLMLDEIGDLSQLSQVKLLRVLQEGEYLPLGLDTPRHANVRIVAATNEDLPGLIKKGMFRKDLSYRLRTHHIHLPLLRERRDDIPRLVNYFLEKAAQEQKKEKPAAPARLFSLLDAYSFPGNVRELQAMIYDAVSQHKSGVLSLKVFRSKISDTDGRALRYVEPDSPGAGLMTFSEVLPTLRQSEKLLIAEAMKRANGNQTVAAGMLGISQQALSKRFRRERGT